MNSDRVMRIELFAFDTRPSFANRPTRAGSMYLILRLTCGEQVSYGECVIFKGGQVTDLIKWGAFLKCIHHATLEEVLMTLRLHEKEWTTNQQVLLQSALFNLLQARYPRLKIAAGSARNEHHIALSIPHTASMIYSTNRCYEDLNLSQLFDESVSYYSILS